MSTEFKRDALVVQVILTPGRKAHLYLGGILCGAQDVVGSYASLAIWYQIRPRMRCRKCSLRWERLKSMASLAKPSGA